MRPAAVIPVILAAAVLMEAGAPGSGQPSRSLVGAFYYPWYYPERWTKEPVTDTPQLGWYSSDARPVARRHIQWAQQADLDFFMVSWLAPRGQEDRNLKQAMV